MYDINLAKYSSTWLLWQQNIKARHIHLNILTMNMLIVCE